jgi:hypothetical protein
VSGTSVSDAPPLEHLLDRREVRDLVGLAVADHHVRAPLEDRRHQPGDVGTRVLVVGVGVDDQVGAELEAGVEPGLEARREALVVGQTDDVVDAARARHVHRAVGGAVVYDEPLDGVDARDLARQVLERPGERLLLVEAGNLDDELHAARLVA